MKNSILNQLFLIWTCQFFWHVQPCIVSESKKFFFLRTFLMYSSSWLFSYFSVFYKILFKWIMDGLWIYSMETYFFQRRQWLWREWTYTVQLIFHLIRWCRSDIRSLFILVWKRYNKTWIFHLSRFNNRSE